MDWVWDTSKYPPKSLVTFCHMKVINGQNFGKCLKILSFDVAIRFWVRFLSKM